MNIGIENQGNRKFASTAELFPCNIDSYLGPHITMTNTAFMKNITALSYVN